MYLIPDIGAASLLVLLILAAARDIGVRRLPDHLSVLVAAVGFVILIILLGSDAFWALPRAILLFVLLALLGGAGFMGGGDIKMLSALALGVSGAELVRLLVYTVMAGGVLAILYLFAGKLLRAGWLEARWCDCRLWPVERRRIMRGNSLPYGVAIAIGWTLAVLPGRV